LGIAMRLYIKGMEAISIQDPLTDEGIWNPKRYAAVHLRCVEPVFSNFLSPIASRRMSPIVKRAIVTSKMCLAQAKMEMPEAIITGTGFGCVEDTEKFLDTMVRKGEHFLQPTYFIQSTHNTISSQIALQLKCHGFNNTHVHRGISFESALHEAWILFQLGQINTALVAGNDELTPVFFKLLGRLGGWRKQLTDSLSVVQNPDKGTFAGEGSATFVISNQQSGSDNIAIEGVEILFDSVDITKDITSFLQRTGVPFSEVDVVITGRNGDAENDALYEKVVSSLGLKEAFYKNLCGEYFTAPAYGMYVASKCLYRKSIPSHLTMDKKELNNVKRILLFHHWQKKNYSFILLTVCGD